jgi:hypothetical protein
VEVALRRRALAEVHDHDLVGAEETATPGQADGVRDLPRDRGVERQHLQALPDVETERAAHVPQERLDERQPVQQLARRLAILRHEPVA